ncbi:hypothetical protein ASPACDRAFT_48470 [Aspergillus aculeatus ATCC 16872]|uniref:2EXR domain-containing protein n=1 Tax=Aspergillus aculeatus (strain ATCC 16872 / CBS 172.66 / WB 5094) TaxID=690307 RepID=A0A1L9WF43_ASPA1|nr:uncharacterized protein ASPACDRAFT_48470 [Aspergillus aculeatus ATCC 16872]OJJ94774.1 hypothetical protein ASPACDRAFT_48470 [Aspergillus aculeatus ATCC 16872]
MTFAQFLKLPPELRHYIWRLTLPDQVRPGVLFPYNEGEFGHDDYLFARMDPVSARLPHLLVNKEANGTARSWARKLGLKIHFRPDIGTGSPVVTHHFDPNRDTLYLHATQLDSFCIDPLDRRVEQLPRKRMPIRDGEGHPRIAISSMSLHLEPRALEKVWWCFPRLERVYIILNPPSLKSAEDGWEILPQGRFLTYRAEGGGFEWSEEGECEWLCGEILYGRVQEAARKLTGSLVAAGVQRFEIRPVSVVKRGKGLSEVAR